MALFGGGAAASELIIDNPFENAVETQLRSKPNQPADLRNIGNASWHVFKAFFVCLIVRHEYDLGIRLGDLLHPLGQFEYRDLNIRSDIENLSNRLAVFHQVDERPNNVADVTKTAALFSIPINRNRPACQRLLHKRWNNHSVLAGL